jgi:hypothetical protein
MKHAVSATVFSVLLANAAVAEETLTQPVKADSVTEDCSKQVWPNFSSACLRNADRATNVRLVTTNRR